MRKLILYTLALGFINLHHSYADTLEFPADSSASLEIPANTSIRIISASRKGNASDSMKMYLNIGGRLYVLNRNSLGKAYINGPATLQSVALVTAISTGIPYKLSMWNGVYFDRNRTGSYSDFIAFYMGSTSDYQDYLSWLNAGNIPLPADYYTGTDHDISTSGILIQYERLTNQQCRNLIIPPDALTKTIEIPQGRKLVFMQNDSTWCLNGTFRNGYSMSNEDGFTLEGPDTLILSNNGSPTTLGGNSSVIFNYYFDDESSPLVTESIVSAIANKITTTAGNLGIATKTDINTAINEGKVSGISRVTASPNTWSLFTTSQIQNMAVGDLVLNRQVDGSFVLNYDIEQSTDLQTWTPYQALSLPLTGLPTDKAFVRIKAKQ